MSYKKKYNNYGKKNYKKNYNNNNKVDLAIKKANKALAMMQKEFKVIDNDVTVTSLTTTADIRLLNACIQGTDYDERIGRSIQNQSVECRILVTKNPSSTSYEHVRVLLVLDTDPKGATIAFNEIVEASTAPITSPRNLTNRKRVIILKEWVFTLNKDGGSQSYHELYYRKVNFHSIYNSGNAGTIADMSENSLYLVSVSDTGTNAPSLTFYSRVRFIDD